MYADKQLSVLDESVTSVKSPALSMLRHLRDAVVAVDSHPIAGLDHRIMNWKVNGAA